MSTTKLAEALRLGREGAPPTEAERLLFEEWMRGHCWALCATWNGTQYVHEAEAGGDLYPPAMNTRQLFAAWRDRAALASYEAQAEAKPAPACGTVNNGIPCQTPRWRGERLCPDCNPNPHAEAKPAPAGFVLVPMGFIEAAQRIVQEFAARNPKWPMWENGEPEPRIQDPSGAHAWLEQSVMLAAAPAAPASADTKDAQRYRWLQSVPKAPVMSKNPPPFTW